MDALPLIMAAIKSESYHNLKPAIRQMLASEIKKYYTPKPVSISADDEIYEAAKLINRHNVDRLPVIDKGRLVGVVSKIDILRVLA
jgi:CBS domain-containing protein